MDQAVVTRHPRRGQHPSGGSEPGSVGGIAGGRGDYRIKVPISTSEHLLVA